MALKGFKLYLATSVVAVCTRWKPAPTLNEMCQNNNEPVNQIPGWDWSFAVELSEDVVLDWPRICDRSCSTSSGFDCCICWASCCPLKEPTPSTDIEKRRKRNSTEFGEVNTVPTGPEKYWNSSVYFFTPRKVLKLDIGAEKVPIYVSCGPEKKIIHLIFLWCDFHEVEGYLMEWQKVLE